MASIASIFVVLRVRRDRALVNELFMMRFAALDHSRQLTKHPE